MTVVIYKHAEKYRWVKFDEMLQYVGNGAADTKAAIEKAAKAAAKGDSPKGRLPKGFERPDPILDEVRWAKEPELDFLRRANPADE